MQSLAPQQPALPVATNPVVVDPNTGAAVVAPTAQVLGYDTNTGEPIYQAPQVPQATQVLGVEPVTGAAIIGYDTTTGAPIYQAQQPVIAQ